MKISRCLFPLAVLVIGAGCQSRPTAPHGSQMSQIPAQEDSRAAKTTNATNQIARNVHYRVQVIPNTRLTPTSRAGDKPRQVYSSNIIAVFAETNGASGGASDGSASPAEQQNK